MPLFEYQAVDEHGRLIRDRGSFSSIASLYQSLKARGYTLVDYKRRVLDPARLLPERKVDRLVLAEFFRNLSLLLKGGVPLRDCLEDMAQTIKEQALRAAIKEMIMALENGELLSAAMKRSSKVFGRIPIVLVSIGEETGRLDSTLVDAAKHLERMEEIVSNTKRALTYPIFVVAAMTGALCFWMLYVLPKVLKLFENMGMTDLPWPTRVLMAAVGFFNSWWPVFPVALLAIAMFRFLASRNERFKYYWDLMIMKIPLVGGVIRASQLAFFFEYLSLLIHSGIDIVRSFDIMADSISHQVLKKGIMEMKEEIINGTDLTHAFKRLPVLEPFVNRMIHVGEQTGELPKQLSVLASYYRDHVNKLVDALGKTLEPILIVIAGFIFALIAMGLLGPIYDLMGRIE